MTKTVVIFCGKEESGKTRTMKVFFGRDIDKQLKPDEIFQRTIRGKKIVACGLSSPQERVRRNYKCDPKLVIDNIEQRLDKIRRTIGDSYDVLLMPFTIYKNRDRNIDEECITEPIRLLKRRFNVHVIYLRKITKADLFMKTVKETEIESIEDDERRQAQDLENFIKKL